MKKKLYYTVEYETDYINEQKELTGNKIVTVYTIKDNTPKKWFDLDLSNNDRNEKEIVGWLDDNGYGDDEWELIQL